MQRIFLQIIIILLSLTTSVYAFDTSKTVQIQLTDCSGIISEGLCCWDTDDDILCCGNGVACVVDSGDITAVGSCLTGSCATIGNGAISAGYLDFLEDSDNGTNYIRLIGPASTANVTVTLPAETGTICTTGSVCTGYAPIASNQAITCATNVCTDVAGAYAVYLTSEANAVADVLTLANGIAGQEKLVVLKTDGGDDIDVTPTNFANGIKVTLNTAGESVLLHFDGTKWNVVSTYGGVIS